MEPSSIRAYDNVARVAAYDADMDLMHPNRYAMAEAMLALLATAPAAPRLVVDLGTGTGFLLERLLRRFPECRAVAVDGAPEMVSMAQARLGSLADRVDFVTADFRSPQSFNVEHGAADAVISAYALHHLNFSEKSDAAANCLQLLKPGGWFVNADLALADDDRIEALAQQMRVSGIVERAAGRDPRFRSAAETRRFLDDLERNEADQPLREADDLSLLRKAGYRHVSVFWKHTREIVYGGMR